MVARAPGRQSIVGSSGSSGCSCTWPSINFGQQGLAISSTVVSLALGDLSHIASANLAIIEGVILTLLVVLATQVLGV